MKILVTGGLGYIGAHVVAKLDELGHEVDIIDCNENSPNFRFVADHLSGVLYNDEIHAIIGDLYGQTYDAVIHLAALIEVERSTREPNTFWRNNLTALMDLCSIRTKHLIFASTGTAFNPTNAYASSKVACENYILDVARGDYPWFKGHTIFRFYNVSGLRDGVKPTGQPTHLIRIAAEAAAGKRNGLKVYGSDYDTKDGTAVRDYIHVEDIAGALVKAVEVGPANTPFECLGTGTGTSILEVIQSMKRVSGVDFRVTMAPRRQGDDVITRCPTQWKHLEITKSLDDMCLSAFRNV